jgi:hypothetical protein
MEVGELDGFGGLVVRVKRKGVRRSQFEKEASQFTPPTLQNQWDLGADVSSNPEK